jgi:uncharacterized protein (DUF58 family)
MLPSEIVQQVRRLQIHTNRQVADVLAGAYHSVFRGRGVEFDEVRPYVPGDDVRTIDWNVTARVGAPYVKRYVEERQLTVLLLVDTSGSQDFGSASRSKREAAAELSALLAFSAIHNDDKIGLLLFHREVEDYIPPRKGQKHALRVVREVLARGRGDEPTDVLRRRPGLVSLSRTAARHLRRLAERRRGSPGRSTDIAHALEFCRRVLPRRAVLFLVSDFLDEGYLGVLRNANRKHDVVAVRVTDERERRFERAGLLVLQDAETGQTRLVDTGSAAFREAVRELNERRTEELERDLRGAGIDVLTIDATRPVLDPLLAFLKMREKRSRRR